MKNLALVSEKEQREFLNSFDSILSDIDGVVFYVYRKLPGSSEAMESFRQLGKNVHFLTNSNVKTSESCYDYLLKAGLIVDKKDLTCAGEALLRYLKRINFQKKIYLIGEVEFKKEIEKHGFEVEFFTENPKLGAGSDLKQLLVDDENVGAVLIDLDFNYTFLKIQKIFTYLQRPDCLLFSGAPDLIIPYAPGKFLLGLQHLQDCVEKITGKKAIRFSKPSQLLKECIFEKYQIKDPSRYLFIGDSICSDMSFATICKFKKLLVLTGATKLPDLEEWKYSDEWKPDYYVESLDVMNNIIEKLNIIK